jgi:galacturonosyltransferase
MNKKIVIIGNNSGGMYVFRRELITELVKQRYSITVLTPFDTNVDDLKNIGIELIEVPINRRSVNPIEDLKLMRVYKKILKKIKPDLVITYTIKPNVYGGYACRSLNIPYVANITGVGTAFQNEGLLKKIVTAMYKVAFKKVKTVFFENAEDKQIFINSGIVKETNTCLLNGAGVNLEHFNVTDYPQGNTTTFLFMGRIMKEKGIDELFAAMDKLYYEGVKCSLNVLGSYEEDYKDIIDKHQEKGWLHYYGHQDDVRPYIAQSHCFVLPSWHEGMANTNLECAASGRPVITSNIHGCLEAVEDGVTGYLCEKQNADNLCEVMKKFINLSYEERKVMGLAGRKRMEDIFDKRKVVEETINAMNLPNNSTLLV